MHTSTPMATCTSIRPRTPRSNSGGLFQHPDSLERWRLVRTYASRNKLILFYRQCRLHWLDRKTNLLVRGYAKAHAAAGNVRPRFEASKFGPPNAHSLLGKRRKSRCILTSENDSVCTGCLARGSKCLSQLDADREDGTLDRKSTRERLGLLESLVETLIDKVDNRCERIGYVPRCDRGTRESLAYDVLPPSSSQSSNLESAPIFSLFHNAVVSTNNFLRASRII